MTKEEATRKLADIIFNAAKNGYMPYDTNDEMCAMNIAKKHIYEFYTSLPSNLDEAAEDCIQGLIPEAELPATTPFALEYVIEMLYKTFKAGAEWMAEQLKNMKAKKEV